MNLVQQYLSLQVATPGGRGVVWGIEPGKVLVEHDFMYLVAYDIDQVKPAV